MAAAGSCGHAHLEIDLVANVLQFPLHRPAVAPQTRQTLSANSSISTRVFSE